MSKLEERVAFIKNYAEKNNCKGVVLGLSGGKDSTTVAMLSKKIFGNNIFAVLMPNGEQPDIKDSLEIAKRLDISYGIVNLKDTFKAFNNAIEEKIVKQYDYDGVIVVKDKNICELTDKSKTNILPRLRMATLYAIAQTIGYLVIGTGNKSESYIGWTTKFGDASSDFNPLGTLTCTEVKEIGAELANEFFDSSHAKEFICKYIEKTPSDGLSGKSDEEAFGFSYLALDKYITTGSSGDLDIDLKIKDLHEKTEHKRVMPTIE